jgi:hypothetical protein
MTGGHASSVLPTGSPQGSPAAAARGMEAAAQQQMLLQADGLEAQRLQQENLQMREAGQALEARLAALQTEKAALEQRQASLQQQVAAAASAVSAAPRAVPGVGHGRPKAPTPPEFHGTKTSAHEIDVFVREMLIQFSYYGAGVFPDDESKVRFAAMYLKGRAAEWWDAEDKSHGIEYDWHAFVERLRAP